MNVTYRVRKPSVWYVWSLLVHTHNLLHVLKAGITGDHVVKRRLVVFYDTCEEEAFTFQSTFHTEDVTELLRGTRVVVFHLTFL